MRTVKPREIFNLLPQCSPFDRMVQLPMPQGPYGDEPGWGLTLLETFLLIAMAKHVKARKFFEFGTWKGHTALALSLNCPELQIITVDKTKRVIPEFQTHLNICQLCCDSREFHTEWIGTKTCDIVFIDGGHDQETLENDTRIAEQLSTLTGLIVWHDCGHPDQPHIQPWLEKTRMGAVRIESTWLAVEGLL